MKKLKGQRKQVRMEFEGAGVVKLVEARSTPRVFSVPPMPVFPDEVYFKGTLEELDAANARELEDMDKREEEEMFYVPLTHEEYLQARPWYKPGREIK